MGAIPIGGYRGVELLRYPLCGQSAEQLQRRQLVF